MDCKIPKTCPYGRSCSIIKEAQFCAYHQLHADEVPMKLDFIPIDEISGDELSAGFDEIIKRADQRSK
jgi:hypothetical protein